MGLLSFCCNYNIQSVLIVVYCHWKVKNCRRFALFPDVIPNRVTGIPQKDACKINRDLRFLSEVCCFLINTKNFENIS